MPPMSTDCRNSVNPLIARIGKLVRQELAAENDYLKAKTATDAAQRAAPPAGINAPQMPSPFPLHSRRATKRATDRF